MGPHYRTTISDDNGQTILEEFHESSRERWGPARGEIPDWLPDHLRAITTRFGYQQTIVWEGRHFRLEGARTVWERLDLQAAIWAKKPRQDPDAVAKEEAQRAAVLDGLAGLVDRMRAERISRGQAPPR